VGWQANRFLWQGNPINMKTMGVEKSEVGVVPIFGGISWTDNEIQQIWYLSTAYQDEKGALTGAYNFDKAAHDWGKLPVEERLTKARNDASKFGKKFAEGLEDGVTIAWQNMPHIKDGWAYWQAVGDAEYARDQFNVIAQGSEIYEETGKKTNANFFIVGDQISSLPGWQEGAIAAALNVISRMAYPELKIPHLKNLPDTRLMVLNMGSASI
jgi:monoamine oxidase